MSLKCVNGRFEENQAHDFTDTTAMLVTTEDMPPDDSCLIFCRRCGEVRILALAPPDDGPDVRIESLNTRGRAP